MSELVIWSLWVSSLGTAALLFKSFMNGNQTTVGRRLCEEEEILTSNESTQSLVTKTDNQTEHSFAKTIEWEYKIVRANRDLFRNPAIFQRLCQEEAEVGWILLEKFDNRRVRFKRPITLREQKSKKLPRFDPYRSYYGSPYSWTFYLTIIMFIIAIIIPAYFTYTFVFRRLNQLLPSSPQAPALLKSSPKNRE